MTPDNDEHHLPPDLLRYRFDTIIRPEMKRLATVGDPPLAFVFGAQPGAGKSTAVAAFAQTRDDPLTQVVGDDLRQVHPAYDELMRTSPGLMPAATAQAAAEWVAMALATAAERRWNVVWETTFRSPEALARDILRFTTAGYRVGVTALAVPRPVSMRSTVERYLAMVETFGVGRTVPVKAHDDAYHAAATTLQIVAAIPGVDVSVIDREGKFLYPGRYRTPLVALAAGRRIPAERIPQLVDLYSATRVALLKHPGSGPREEMLAVLRAGERDLGRAAARNMRRAGGPASGHSAPTSHSNHGPRPGRRPPD